MDPYASLSHHLSEGHTIVIDGATGTELERRGAAMHDAAWCAMATVTAPDVLRAVHEDYIRAGARLVTTNTFSTNRNMLDPAGLGDQFETINRQAVRIAIQARDNCDASDRVVVAGAMSHQVPLLPNQAERNPDTLPSPQLAAARFDEMATLLAEEGVDIILLEMMSDDWLANLAIEAARSTGLPYWIGYAVRPNEHGEPCAYSHRDKSVTEMIRAIPPAGADVVGIMHSQSNLTGPAIADLAKQWNGPLMAYPDSGYFKMPHWQFEDIISPAELLEFTREWQAAGVQVIGGCCGLGLEHIEAMVESQAFKVSPVALRHISQ